MFENDKCLIGKHLIYFEIGYNDNIRSQKTILISANNFFSTSHSPLPSFKSIRSCVRSCLNSTFKTCYLGTQLQLTGELVVTNKSVLLITVCHVVVVSCRQCYLEKFTTMRV